MYDVIVIGAGLAGLSAAHFLKQKGADLLVLEKEPELGGRVRTRTYPDRANLAYEQGAQFFSRHFSTVFMLAKQLRVPVKRLPFCLQMQVAGEWRQACYDRWSVFFQIPGVPWRVRHQLFQLVRSASRGGGFPAGNKPVSDMVLHQFAARFDPTVYEYVIAPFWQTMFFSDPTHQSSRHFLLHFGSPASQRIYRPEGGMTRFIDSLAEGLSIWRETEVKRLESLGASVLVEAKNRHGFQQLSARYVLLTVPAPQVPSMLAGNPFASEIMQLIRSVRYSSTAIVSLHADREVDSSVFGFSIPPKYNSILSGGVIEHRLIWNVMLTDRAYRQMREMTDEQMVQQVRNEMDRLFPDRKKRFQLIDLYRWPTAIPCFAPGDVERMEHLSRHLKDSRSRIQLAGDYLQLGCTEGAVRSGIQAAKSVFQMIER